MKKVKNLILATTFLFSFVGLAFQSSASEDKGVWVRIDQTYEDGAWQILEHCEGIGLGCTFGDYRALTIHPE